MLKKRRWPGLKPASLTRRRLTTLTGLAVRQTESRDAFLTLNRICEGPRHPYRAPLRSRDCGRPDTTPSRKLLKRVSLSPLLTLMGKRCRGVRIRNSSLVKATFWAIIFGSALILPSFAQLALSTSAVTATSVTVIWNKSPDRDVKGYRLHCGLTPGRDYSRFVDLGNVTTYTFSNLVPGKTYYCVVTAYNAAGKEGSPSHEISFRVSPSNAPAITSSTVTLRWDKSPDRGVQGYRLHYGTMSSRNYSKFVDVGNVMTYTLSSLIPGKTYYCVVTAYNAAGRESPQSNEITFTVSQSTLKERK
jgi:Fibronectin type III domain